MERTMANPLIKKAKSYKKKSGPIEKDWTANEVELFVMWLKDELTSAQIRYALDLKGSNSILSHVATALRQGCQKKYIIMRFQKPVERAAT